MHKLIKNGFLVNAELVGIEVGLQPVCPECAEGDGKRTEKCSPTINLLVHGRTSCWVKIRFYAAKMVSEKLFGNIAALNLYLCPIFSGV